METFGTARGVRCCDRIGCVLLATTQRPAMGTRHGEPVIVEYLSLCSAHALEYDRIVRGEAPVPRDEPVHTGLAPLPPEVTAALMCMELAGPLSQQRSLSAEIAAHVAHVLVPRRGNKKPPLKRRAALSRVLSSPGVTSRLVATQLAVSLESATNLLTDLRDQGLLVQDESEQPLRWYLAPGLQRRFRMAA